MPRYLTILLFILPLLKPIILPPHHDIVKQVKWENIIKATRNIYLIIVFNNIDINILLLVYTFLCEIFTAFMKFDNIRGAEFSTNLLPYGLRTTWLLLSQYFKMMSSTMYRFFNSFKLAFFSRTSSHQPRLIRYPIISFFHEVRVVYGNSLLLIINFENECLVY